MNIEDCVLDLIRLEYRRATFRFPRPWNSAHEGYAVVLEELDEAWDAIKRNDTSHAKREMVQVAAMAIRFIIEATEPKPQAVPPQAKQSLGI
jgi:hypothetical protein